MRAGLALIAMVALVLSACGGSTIGARSARPPNPAASPPEEVTLSPGPGPGPTAPVETPGTSSAPLPEWRVNLVPSIQQFQLNRPVPLVDMETGQVVASIAAGPISVAYETTVGGRPFWMTDYSVGRGIPNGLPKSEITAAVSAPPDPGPVLPASLADGEWTRLPTTQHVIGLTFDAGGNSAGVDSILGTLAATGAPGTFFLTGRWAEVYPDEARRIAGAHPVGDHTYSHPHLTTLTDAEVVDQVSRGADAITQATGHDPHPLFRFPYGESDARTLGLVHQLGYGGIRWTVDTLGWKGRAGGQSADSVVSRVLANLQPGEIVLMHVGGAEDGTTLDADALPRVIAEVRARGYTPVTIGQYAER